MCLTGYICVCVCVCVLVCMYLLCLTVSREKKKVWHFVQIKSQLFNFPTHPLIQYFGMNFSFLCHQALHLSMNLWLTLAVKMPFDSFCLLSSLFLCTSFLTSSSSHFPFSLCHRIVPLPFFAGWDQDGWGGIWMIWYAATVPFCFIAGVFVLSP